MATAILPQPAPSAPVDLPLAHEIADVEGIGLKTALVLAELYRDELLAYAAQWNAAEQQERCEKSEISERRSERCPQCGAALESRQAYVGGRGYCYVEVCSGDGTHYSRRVQR